MSKERYNELMKIDGPNLTQDEIEQGWHFCFDWDGLLVQKGSDGEGESCTCDLDRYQRIFK